MSSHEELESTVARIASRFSGRIGVAAKNLSTGETFSVGAEVPLPIASVIKIPVLVEVFLRAERGALSLDQPMTMTESDRTYGSGILKDFAAGLTMPVIDFATAMMIVSDNTATNMLVDLVGGIEVVNAGMASLGLPTIELHQPVPLRRKLRPGDVIDVGSVAEGAPSEVCELMEMIASGAILSSESRERFVWILEQQQFLDQVPRYFVHDMWWDELGSPGLLRVANKTGFHPGTRADAGIVRMPLDVTFVYCVANTESADASMSAEAEGAVVNGVIGRLLLEHWWPQSAGPAPVLESHLWSEWMSATRSELTE